MAQLPAHVQEHIYSVGIVDYFAGRGPLPEGCKLYETRAAARTASGIATWAAARGHAWEDARDGAWDAAEAAARDAAEDAVQGPTWDPRWDPMWNPLWDPAHDPTWRAAWDAAGAAALLAICLLMRDLIDPKHLAYARQRWAIWAAGYGVAAEVDGVHYCYKRP